ncbi:hypothetical protein CsSME_00002493 [Camellia sinensis var. sinensis]
MKWTTFKLEINLFLIIFIPSYIFLIGTVWSYLTFETSTTCITLYNKGHQTVKKNFYFIATSSMSRGVEVVCAQQCEGSYYTYRLPSISSEY